MAVAGIDLRPLWQTLIAKLIDGTIEAGEGLDLSLIAQLLGDKPAGLAIQHEILASHQLFRSPCAVTKPRLRVLALAAATDMGSNTPIEFLLEESDIELMTLYVIAGNRIAGAAARSRHRHRDRVRLRRMPRCAAQDRCAPPRDWPRPLLNPPHRVGNLDRDKLHRVLDGIEGLEIPATIAVTRAQLSRAVALGRCAGRHRGRSCISRHRQAARIACRRGPCEDRRSRRDEALSRRAAGAGILHLALCRLLRATMACFANTGSSSSMAGLTPATWRSPIAGTSGISTPECRQAPSKRLEEETFMQHIRHRLSRAAMRPRWPGSPSGSVSIISRSTARKPEDGSLLIFEADNTAIVHDMDPPDLFPYKAPQMRKVFDAFAAMLVSPRPAEPGARGMTTMLRAGIAAVRIERDARSAELGRDPRPGSSHAR